MSLFTSYRPSHRLNAICRGVAETLTEQSEALTVLQNRAYEIMLKPISASMDMKKFADTVVNKFAWVKEEYLASKELLTRCKEVGDDGAQARRFFAHLEEAHLAYYRMKLAQQHGLGPDSFKIFFDSYTEMITALHACSLVANSRW